MSTKKEIRQINIYFQIKEYTELFLGLTIINYYRFPLNIHMTKMCGIKIEEILKKSVNLRIRHTNSTSVICIAINYYVGN